MYSRNSPLSYDVKAGLPRQKLSYVCQSQIADRISPSVVTQPLQSLPQVSPDTPSCQTTRSFFSQIL
jgi:hypothetical protein